MSEDKQKQDTRKEIISDLKRQIKTEKDPKKKENLISTKKKMELWDKAMSGDSEALIAVAEERGLYKTEEQEEPKAIVSSENKKQLVPDHENLSHLG